MALLRARGFEVGQPTQRSLIRRRTSALRLGASEVSIPVLLASLVTSYSRRYYPTVKTKVEVTTTDPADPNYRRDLGNGLLLRWSRAEDAQKIVDTCGHVFRRAADEQPNRKVGAWLLDVLSGRHPHMGPGDYAIVEDAGVGRIVSGTCLISHEIEMEGIRLPFGRPEAVFTHPDYRNRGLVRATFELVHARSGSRGHLVQGITGIPFYYRLFGYEYAADLGGEVNVYFATIPALKQGETDKFQLRIAADDEMGVVKSIYDLDRSGMRSPPRWTSPTFAGSPRVRTRSLLRAGRRASSLMPVAAWSDMS